MKCSTTRRMIDQADDPASLVYETAAHIEGCSSCRQFASEREQLRKLLLEPRRVSAPANFEAMVARRLAERGSGGRFRLAIGFYLRAAGAAAALACLVLVIQMARPKPAAPTLALPSGIATVNPPEVGTNGGTDGSTLKPLPSSVAVVKTTASVHHPRRRDSLRQPVDESPVTTVIAGMTAQPRALILLRNAGSEQEIAVPMVTVGAQPWVPVSVSSQDARGLRMAF
jgi:hypothetical protein